jgi:hypothetical protein
MKPWFVYTQGTIRTRGGMMIWKSRLGKKEQYKTKSKKQRTSREGLRVCVKVLLVHYSRYPNNYSGGGCGCASMPSRSY